MFWAAERGVAKAVVESVKEVTFFHVLEDNLKFILMRQSDEKNIFFNA